MISRRNFLKALGVGTAVLMIPGGALHTGQEKPITEGEWTIGQGGDFIYLSACIDSMGKELTGDCTLTWIK